MSSKPGFSFISLAPKGLLGSQMRRIRQTQQAEKAKYRGVSVQYTGRPGNGCHSTKPAPEKLEELEKKWKEWLQQAQNSQNGTYTYIKFQTVSEHQLIKELSPNNTLKNPLALLYKTYKAEARLVRSILQNSGFSYSDSHDWNLMWLGTHPPAYLYQGLNEFQKINHFPNSFEVTRKDKLSMNFKSMQQKYGKQAFDFIPETFVLPYEFSDFYSSFHREKSQKWIVKPFSSSQGKGIFILESIQEVPVQQNFVISRYIQNPLLIQGLKFDLRIYVLVTSFDPLRIYVYDQGLARFASQDYTIQNTNKFAHLTNYSVNKKNSKFVQNTDYNQDGVGHKWSFSALFKHLANQGIDIDFIWNQIFDIIIKTILSIESKVVDSVRRSALHRNNCFDLLGFDVLIDQNLKPWLLEVNLSPSLATDSPLDLFIKGHLIAHTFNTVGIKPYDRKKESTSRINSRIKAKRAKLGHTREKSFGILPKKQIGFERTSIFRDTLLDTLQQYQRKGNFIMIYPSMGSDQYDQYFSTPRSTNKALYKALFLHILDSNTSPIPPTLIMQQSRPRTTATRVSLKLQLPLNQRSPIKFTQKYPQSSSSTTPQATLNIHSRRRSILTGDDFLMEYISRLMKALQDIREDCIKLKWKRCIDRFIWYYVWHGPDRSAAALWERLDGRVQEMKARQLKMLQAVRRRYQKNSDPHKRKVLKSWTVQKLQEILQHSNLNIGQETMQYLIKDGKGLLSEILNWVENKTPKSDAFPKLTDSRRRIRPQTSGHY